MTLAHPAWALLLLPVAGAVAWLEWRRATTPARRLARLASRAVLLGLLGLALAGAGAERAAPPVTRTLLLVDRALEAPALAAELAAARAALGLPPTAEQVPFGSPPGEPLAPAPLAPALLEARARLGTGASGRVHVLASARTDLDGLRALAEELARAGATLQVEVLPRQEAAPAPQPRILQLEAPADLVQGAFALRASVAAPAGTSAQVLAGGRLRAEQAVLAPAADGTQVLAFDGLELEPGLHAVALVLRAPPGPGAAEAPALAVASASVQVGATPRVLACLGDRASEARLAAVRAQGLELETLQAAGLEQRLAPGAPAAEVLLLDAAAAVALPHAAEEALATRVEQGLGLLLLAGDDAAAWAALAGSPIGRLLPLEPLAAREEPPAPPPPAPPAPPAPPVEPPPPAPGEGLTAEREPEEALPIALLLVLDRSASMQGTPWAMAAEAAARAADVLSPYDRVGVITFAQDATVDLPMGPVATAGSVTLHLPADAAGTATNLVLALRAAAEVVRRETVPIRHVLLLTDGMHNPTGMRNEQALWSDVVRPLAAAGATLTVVGLGEGHDARTLSELARWARGQYRRADHPRQVPTVFVVDTQGVAQRRSQQARARLPDPAARPPAETPTPPPATPPAPPPAPQPGPPPALPGPPSPTPPAPPAAGSTTRRAPLRLAAPHPATKGLRPEDLPEVEAPLRAGLRAAGQALLVREEPPGSQPATAPVLAARRAGVGRVLVLAARPGDGGLKAWPQLGQLLGQSLRSLLAPLGSFAEALPPRVLATPEGERLDLSGLAPGAYLVRTGVEDGELGPPQPAVVPLLEGSLALPSAPQGALVRLEVRDEAGQLRAAQAYVAAGGRPTPQAAATRAAVAEALAGLPPPRPPAPRPERLPWLPWLALLAALWLPLDAWLHRQVA